MFKATRRKLIYFSICIFSLLLLANLAPIIRPPLADVFIYPLGSLAVIKREIAGILLYHRHLIQNESLRRDNDLLRRKLNSLREIELENVRFKNILSFKQKAAYKVIAARVIARAADNWSSLIIIDKGAYHGIKRWMPVTTCLGLVGRVIDTSTRTSKIMLINDPNLSVSGLVQRSRQEGIICGTLEGKLIMRYLPLDADIKVADIIITSGLTGGYPKGLYVGTVASISEESLGLSRYAVIKPTADLTTLEEVLIIFP